MLCGVIGIEVDSSEITSLVDDISVYDNGFAYLVGTDEEIYYTPVDDHLMDQAHTDHGFAEEHDTLVNGMELVIHADYSDIQRDSYHVMFIILGCAVLILLAFILLSYWMSKRIVKPLELLAKSAEELAEGNANVDISCNTNDEIGVLAKALSITSEKLCNYRKHINSVAYRDSLTGVKNSTAYNDTRVVMEQRIKNGEISAFSVVVADVNMLKMTNDTYGHEAGNQLLVSASRLICSTFKRSPVFRIGGDEFLVILENDDFENRFDLMNEINEKYHENPDMVANNQVAVTVACGISDFILGADSSFEDVVNKADAAMYARKQQMKINLAEKVQV
jgi:diguanylate cyclase (GGDEF)-like protein